MSTISSLTITPAGVSPSSAASAYGRVNSGAGPSASSDAGGGFGSMLQRAMQGVVDAGHQADAQAMQGIAGNANLTDVVTAVSRAQLALQTTTAVRDRVVAGLSGNHAHADLSAARFGFRQKGGRKAECRKGMWRRRCTRCSSSR